MKKGSYPIIAIFLILLIIVVEVFKSQINALSPIVGVILIILTALVGFGLILLALWDTEMIGKKKQEPKYRGRVNPSLK